MFGFRKQNKLSAQTKDIKTIWDLDGVPPFQEFYDFGICKWKSIYKGFYKPWHIIKCPTPAEPYGERKLLCMGMGQAICQEMASLIWSEKCTIRVALGDSETQPLDDFVNDVLKKNNFWTKLGKQIEQELALGGAAINVWYDGEIKLGYAMADQFIPTDWDNAGIKGGIFIHKKAKDGVYYTRLEWHQWTPEGEYKITNMLFKSPDQSILGDSAPLNEAYAGITPESIVENALESLFAYYSTANSNNIDDNSPLGVSIYSNALDTLFGLDITYDSLIRDFRLGKSRIIAPAWALKPTIDEHDNLVRMFDTDTETYEAINTGVDDTAGINFIAPPLRVNEHVEALNAHLSTLCLQTGFSSGTFTFDKATGLKTATEIISENSKTYKTIRAQQDQIKPAIEHVVRNILTLAQLYEIQWQGNNIAKLAALPYEIKITFDDSILQDRQTNINEGILLCTNGLMSKEAFMRDILNYTDEQVKAELQRIKNDNSVTGFDVNNLVV